MDRVSRKVRLKRMKHISTNEYDLLALEKAEEKRERIKKRNLKNANTQK